MLVDVGVLGGLVWFWVVFIFGCSLFVCVFWVGTLFGWLLLGVCGCLLLDICSGVVLQFWVCLFCLGFDWVGGLLIGWFVCVGFWVFE